ncbi:unnamed protein product [Staurois parvus]|uniref:Uncharacterized protein n=1 Tax=Staurois parvus TaxID=386267 RepID=A0ABN9CRK7_9NEOB|nr:unnamed protein product [Staurois parvus]
MLFCTLYGHFIYLCIAIIYFSVVLLYLLSAAPPCLVVPSEKLLEMSMQPVKSPIQGRTDHLETRALPKGPGCPWNLFHRLF